MSFQLGVKVTGNTNDFQTAMDNAAESTVALGKKASQSFSLLSTRLTAVRTSALQVQLGFSKLERSVASFGGGVKSFAAPILTDLRRIPPAAASASAAITQLAPATQKARTNTLELSRVIQDLPFGFAGISNNLTQLIPGVGALGLAFSALVSIVTFSQVGFGAWTRGLDGAKNKATETAEEFKSIGDIIASGTGNVAAEITKVEALAGVLRSATASQEQRNRALRELKEINKSYFGDLTTERNSLELLNKAVNDYTDAISKQAIVKELEGEIGKVGAAYFKQAQIVKDLQKAEFERASSAEKATRDLRIEASKSGVRVFDLSGDQNAIAKQISNLKDAKNILAPIEKQFNDLKNLFSSLTIEGLNIKSLDSATDKVEDALKKRIAALETLKNEVGLARFQEIELSSLRIKLNLRDGIKNGFTDNDLQQLNEDIETELNKQLTKPVELNLIANPKATIDTANALKVAVDSVSSTLDGLSKKGEEDSKTAAFVLLKERAEALAKTVQGILTPAFNDFFSAIFTGSGNAFQAFANALKRVIVQLATAVASAAIFAGIVAAITGGNFSGLFKIALQGTTGFSGLGGFGGGRSQSGGSFTPGLANAGFVLQPSIAFSGDNFRIMLDNVNNKRNRS